MNLRKRLMPQGDGVDRNDCVISRPEITMRACESTHSGRSHERSLDLTWLNWFVEVMTDFFRRSPRLQEQTMPLGIEYLSANKAKSGNERSNAYPYLHPFSHTLHMFIIKALTQCPSNS